MTAYIISIRKSAAANSFKEINFAQIPSAIEKANPIKFGKELSRWLQQLDTGVTGLSD